MPDEVSVELPDIPKGAEFEDFIAAYFQSTGFFVEKNISQVDILELDISATEYGDQPEIKLIEIKSGDWEFKEVFKIRGWMDYTGIKEGLFIVQKGRQRFEYYEGVSKELGIKLITVPDLTKTNEYLRIPLNGRSAEKEDIETFRYSYWMEREYYRLLKAWKKSDKSVRRFAVLEELYYQINCMSFFTRNLLDKAKLLYDVFTQNYHITSKCANEMTGSDFGEDHTTIPKEVFKATFYECEFNVLQISTFLEHQSRIRILKCLIDYLLLRDAEDERVDDAGEIMGIKISKLTFLPDSFRTALNTISSHSHFKFYPSFWQWFLYAFGGFILLDKKEEEYQLLEAKTSIPVEEIDNALSAWDIMFPTKGGWFDTNQYSNIMALKLSSLPFRGIGANYRKLMYCMRADGSDGEYSDLGIDNTYTMKNLICWNNLGVEVLSKAK